MTAASHMPSVADVPVLARLSKLDRFLPVWIFAAMALGLLLGRVYPGLGAALDRVQVGGVSVPIAIGLLWMMYPVLAKVRYETIGAVPRTLTGRQRRSSASIASQAAVAPSSARTTAPTSLARCMYLASLSRRSSSSTARAAV